MSLYRKPTNKMKIECLTEQLIIFLGKKDHFCYDMVPVILEGILVVSKLSKEILRPENPKDDVKKLN